MSLVSDFPARKPPPPERLERLLEVCEHGCPIGWACTGCRKGPIGTGPARRHDPPLHRRADFLFCEHEALYDELLTLRAERDDGPRHHRVSGTAEECERIMRDLTDGERGCANPEEHAS